MKSFLKSRLFPNKYIPIDITINEEKEIASMQIYFETQVVPLSSRSNKVLKFKRGKAYVKTMKNLLFFLWMLFAPIIEDCANYIVWKTRGQPMLVDDYDGFSKDYQIQISALKHSLISRLESKKAELEEAEKQRIEAEKAEKARQEALAKANSEKEKRALAEKQRLAREQEEKERLRLENERVIREQAERDKQQAEGERLKKEAEDKIASDKAAKDAEILFDSVTESVSSPAAPASRSGFSIKVLHQAGWVEMFTFWYRKEGVTSTLAELEKKTLKQIKTFCEKAAKEGEMIESKHLKYEAEVKAINKK